MRILAVSDRIHPSLYEHLDRARFPGIDMLISCGDLPVSYLDFLMTNFSVPSFYVRGNHDLEEPPPGWINLDGRVVKERGIRLVGFEGCRLYTQKVAIQYTEQQMWGKVLMAMPLIWLSGGIDIVVTHSPPFGLHDGKDLAHTGFRSFTWLMKRTAPRLFVHGHMHLNYSAFAERVTELGRTKLVNADGFSVMEV